MLSSGVGQAARVFGHARVMAVRVTRALLTGLAVASFAAASHVQGYQSEIDATFDAQFYSLQSPYGSPLIARRRYTQTLALNLYELQADRAPLGPTLSFKSRLRLDSDFGQRAEERNPDSGSYVPGLAEAPIDIMYAYLD